MQPVACATKRYRAPVVRESVEVSLSDFSDDEIAEYMRQNNISIAGSPCDSGGDLWIAEADLNRIYTLSICGQVEPARELALALIGESIGRQL